MNRPIKFRGKRIDNGEWVNGFYLYGAILDEHVIWTDNENWLVDSETVGQCTGIKDNNGKDIFEGDIVNSRKMSFSHSGHFEGMVDFNGIVQFGNGRFYLIGDSGERPDLVFGSSYHKVIGNIYEHHHLLGGTGDE
ncbi:YopX family protein [Paenibacillus larvae]|uniref:YopX protein n=1 Tax=Paenibacillus larvae subsp. larvae TaxID=147375 RepID=A0A2L1U2E4_9BACL|nr:YopX family protein [Paenibacillus larvae]AVF27101.1 YopX protein [Paenibacillus larvae subsp. larvae]MCY9749658.1 YopX family protein [Paenibacillus larvae]MEC0088859.1 YopX family protein [Paenibacillus larvae]